MEKNNNELAVLVVLYGCELDESTTLRSLANLSSLLSNVRVIVWNNGPVYLSEHAIASYKNNINFELVQTVGNISLAKIYNDFIKMIEVENYIIFDHDTNVNAAYIAAAKSFHGFVAVPKIYSNGMLHSPRVCHNPFFLGKEITAVGSGLVISKKTIMLLLNKYGCVFDERFILYGVDTTLFYRLAKIIDLERELVVLPEIIHSLSSNVIESQVVNEFRLKEKSYDFGLRVRFYPSCDKFLLLFILMVKSIVKRSPIKISYIFEAILKGKHYRK